MSQSNMWAAVSDKGTDQTHFEAFPEARSAGEFLRHRLPNDGDRMFFGYNEETEEWVQIINIKGKLHIEVGEAAA